MLKINKMVSQVGLFGALVILGALNAAAEGTSYFSLPADFSDNVTATLTGIAGGILVILGLMFAWRKTVKSVNRS